MGSVTPLFQNLAMIDHGMVMRMEDAPNRIGSSFIQKDAKRENPAQAAKL
jgi:hypothetical protein